MTISNRTFVIFLILLVAVCIVFSAGIYLMQQNRTVVLVTVNGEEYGRYDLQKDQTVVIAPPDGSWHNILVIQDGKARITESDCDNQVCVNTPELTENVVGIIVCLPHGVSVELRESE